MAQVLPAKRPRALTGSIDSLSRGITAGKSRDKRPRHSTPQDNERQSSEDARSIASIDDGISEAEVARHEDASFVWATQQVERDFRATDADRRNIPADAGIIEEIQCINFMCHEHLTVPLGPLINFIIGHNGSGKSAVLTALTLCLGGKATATNRGQNLKSFIKEGKDHSVLQVKIKNQGSLAYKPQHYGDSIIVERHFSRAGTSGFKLKDRNGRLVSNKKAELEDIIDAFSMQIDNPMNVLTQDMARQFLNDSTPKDKYKFFLKGTQLETLSRDYAQIHQSLEEQNSKAEFKKNDLDVYRKRMEELAAKARRAENLEKMRRRENDIIHQAAWARVEEQERKLASVDADIEHTSQLIEQRITEANEASDAYDRADEAHVHAEQAADELRREKEPVQEKVDECRAQWNESKNKRLTLKTRERAMAQDVQQKKQAVADADKILKEHEQRQKEADNGSYAAKVQEVENARVAKSQAVQAFGEHDESLQDLEKRLAAAKAKKIPADQNLQKAQEKARQTRTKISDLKGGQSKWIDGFQNPGSLGRLLQAIDNDRRFRERPVGPMGRHIKLLKPEWGYILDKQFGQALNGFVVTSKADQTILSELMRRCNCMQPIFIGKKDRIDTSHHEPDRALLTWMRALKIDNDLVRNQCIVNQSIDQTVLIESRAEGQAFMHAGGPPTRNVKMCFTMADNSKRRGHFVQVTASGGHNIGPIPEAQSVRMQVDKDDQIRQEELHLDQIQQEIRELQQSCDRHQNQVDACQGAIQDHARTKRRLRLEKQAAAEAVDKLEIELNAAAPDAAGNNQREELLKEAEANYQFAMEQYTDMIAERDSLSTECRSTKEKLTEADAELDELNHKLDKATVKIRTLAGRREEALRAKNHALQEVAEAEENRKEWEVERAKQEKEVQEVTQEAQSVCDRVEVPAGQTSDSLLKTIEKLHKARLETEKQLGGSQDELLRLANEAKRVHVKAHEEFKEITKLRNALATTLDNRQARWKRFRSDISVRARVTFNYLLSERKFRGTLSIDHKAQALDIQVQPDITERSETGRQAKTLSGGEKSFSTICLLLALWDAMGSPIRCLDEFDVFMDNVNREISMGMMIQAARRSIGRQYILITPQAMGNVQMRDDVHIIRMSDPERGQTTLNFGQT